MGTEESASRIVGIVSLEGASTSEGEVTDGEVAARVLRLEDAKRGAA